MSEAVWAWARGWRRWLVVVGLVTADAGVDGYLTRRRQAGRVPGSPTNALLLLSAPPPTAAPPHLAAGLHGHR